MQHRKNAAAAAAAARHDHSDSEESTYSNGNSSGSNDSGGETKADKPKKLSLLYYSTTCVRKIGEMDSNKRRISFLIVVCLLLLLWPHPSPSTPLHKRRTTTTSTGFSQQSSPIATEPLKQWTVAELEAALSQLTRNATSSSKITPPIQFPPIARKKNTGSFKKRTFGCMRDTCRGLEIEDLMDRGYVRLFRSAIKPFTNETSNSPVTYRTNLKYNKVDILLLDTTQLNHVKTTEIWRKFRKDSFVIALEGGDAIGGNKGVQLRRKTQFVNRFGCEYDSLLIQPAQYRLYVKKECEALLASPLTFLLKPEAGSQGQGITFHRQSKDVFDKRPEFLPCEDRNGMKANTRYLAQEYISRPLLLEGSKFDLRVYLFVLSDSPLKNIFSLWYHRGYLRRSLSKYAEISHDRKAYLTNTHFQSSRENFNMSEHIWTMDQLQDVIAHKNRNRISFVGTVLEPHIKEVARFVFESARDRLLLPNWRSNQIIGLDFMLDANLGLHFIEANGYPGFTWSINFDSRKMVEEMFDLMVEHHEAPSGTRFLRPGDRYGGFQLIHNDEDGGAEYNPCIAMGDNALLQGVVQSVVNMKPLPPITVSKDTADDDDNEWNPMLKDFMSQAWNTCAQYLLPTFKLNTTEQHGQFLASRLKFRSSVLSPTLGRVLFPMGSNNAAAILNNNLLLEGQIYPFTNELDFPLERVAYPGGRAPLPTFTMQEDTNNNMFAVGSDFTPRSDDPVEVRANRILDMFGGTTPRLVYRIKWFFIVLRDPLLVLSHEGYAYSVRRAVCENKGGGKYETLLTGEHVMPMDLFQMTMSMETIASSVYVSSILEPVIRRVIEHFVQHNKFVDTKRGNSALVEMDFQIDRDTLKPYLMSMQQHDKQDNESEGDLESIRAKLIADLHRNKQALQLMHRTNAVFFARAKRGDSFGRAFRIVYNALEHMRRRPVASNNVCQDKKFPAISELRFEIDNFHLKRKNAIRRDLHKRISKRWMLCRVRSKSELKKKCMLALLRERYRIIVRQHRLVNNEQQWIDDTMQALIEHKPKAGGDDDDP